MAKNKKTYDEYEYEYGYEYEYSPRDKHNVRRDGARKKQTEQINYTEEWFNDT